MLFAFKESVMNQAVSMLEVMASLEAQIAHHRGQADHHAEREAFHRGHHAAHAAEVEQLTRALEAFKTTAETAISLAARALPAPAALPLPGRGQRFRLARIVERLLEGKAHQERFGPQGIAAEVNRLYGERLRRPVTARQASVALRWLAGKGRIVRLSAGRPFHESEYSRRE
jgi:hypothetical protein